MGDVPAVSGVASVVDIEHVPLMGRLAKGEPPILDYSDAIAAAKRLLEP